MRTCVVCRGKKPKAELLRHVIAAAPGDGPSALVRDERKTAEGRGFYLCREGNCAARFTTYRGWRKHCHEGSTR